MGLFQILWYCLSNAAENFPRTLKKFCQTRFSPKCFLQPKWSNSKQHRTMSILHVLRHRMVGGGRRRVSNRWLLEDIILDSQLFGKNKVWMWVFFVRLYPFLDVDLLSWNSRFVDFLIWLTLRQYGCCKQFQLFLRKIPFIKRFQPK